MRRRTFLKALAAAAPAAASVPFLKIASAQERGKVKITDVKVMRLKVSRGGHEMPAGQDRNRCRSAMGSESAITTSPAWAPKTPS